MDSPLQFNRLMTCHSNEGGCRALPSCGNEAASLDVNNVTVNKSTAEVI